MQFRDLKAQYRALQSDMDAAILRICENADFISGEQVRQLEEDLASYVGVQHCITCANGTDALTLALMAWDIKEGDAVFVPDFTFFASGETVAYEGATPVFCDVCPDTFNMDPQSLRKTIEAVLDEGKIRPRAIITVDLFGLPADYREIQKIADEYGLKVLEDGAQGFGGNINGRKACSFGDISTTSFFPAKPVGCYGDGGAIFTNDDDAAALIRSLAVHGKGSFKYDNIRIGLNSRLDTIQAAVLLVKLRAFKNYELTSINDAAMRYTDMFGDSVTTPVVPEGYGSSWAQYTLRLKNQSQRDGLQAHLKERGIPSMIYYPKPMHAQGAFSGTRSAQAETPVTEKLCSTVLSLPLHPYITPEEQQQVVFAVTEYINK